MKRIIYIATLLGLAACSADEVIDSTENDPNAITFDVTVDNDTRASELFNSGSTKPSFTLWASITPTTTVSSIDDVTLYLDNEGVSYSSSKWSFDDGKAHYFLKDRTLEIFAIHGADVTIKSESDITNLTYPYFTYSTSGSEPYVQMLSGIITIDDKVSDQKDILYATKHAQGATSSALELNFRHALAQINFKIKNDSRFLVVQVNKITLQNIVTTAQLTLYSKPQGTDAIYPAIGASVDTSEPNRECGSWSSYELTDLEVSGSGEDSEYWQKDNDNSSTAYVQFLPGENDLVDIDLTNSNVTGAMLIIPQSFKSGEYTYAEKITFNNGVEAWIPAEQSGSSARRRIVSRTEAEDLEELGDINAGETGAGETGDGETGSGTSNNNGYDGTGEYQYRWVYSHFILSCRVYSIIDVADYESKTFATEEARQEYLNNTNNAKVIYGTSDSFADIYIPVVGNITSTTGEWKAGNKYTYTFVFGGDSSSAKDSGGNQVLFPLTVESTKDAWLLLNTYNNYQ